MNSKQDIINKILELGNSGQEALEYAIASIEKENTSKTLEVLTGAIEAFSTIEEALPLILEPDDNYLFLERQVKAAFEHLVECCENKTDDEILHTLQSNVFPSYMEWLEYLKDKLV